MTEAIKLVQINLNCSWEAFDLLRQHMMEFNVGFAIISEPPHRLVGNSTCFMSTDGLAAVLWRPESSGDWKCRLIDRGEGFVAVRVGEICMISCYVSPNVRISAFTRFLNSLSNAHTAMICPSLVCGDFNAHSTLWGSPETDRRGELVERWSVSLDIRLLNTGATYTCVRPQGCSIVDLS